jgi:hypothetical protein
VLALLVLGGCTDSDDDRAVERVVNEARRAVLAGDGPGACRLLTPHGRKQARAFGRGTCAEVVRARRALAARDPESTWREELRDADVEVLSADADRAQVELRVQDLLGTAARWRIQLRRTSAGWRIDDSNVVPSPD